MTADQHQTDDRPTIAFVLALFGGLWMLASGVGMYGGMGHGRGVHDGRWPVGGMHSQGVICNIAPDYWWPWLGLLAGALIMVGAAVIFAHPALHVGWGVTIIVATVIGFFFGTGGLLAVTLAVTGGILALTWRPKRHAPTQTNSTQ